MIKIIAIIGTVCLFSGLISHWVMFAYRKNFDPFTWPTDILFNYKKCLKEEGFVFRKIHLFSWLFFIVSLGLLFLFI